MPLIDFSKLAIGGNSTAVVDPRNLFTTLRRAARFRRPSDHQGDVLSRWFALRDQRDITLKMNTGSGKTLVGLLLLQSCLNEGVGSAVYVTPDPYLASQVVNEASDLGLLVTTDERSSEFSSHSAILVTTIKKIFNGRSTFGVGPGHTRIPIGAVVVDDAHACLATIDDQFSIQLPRDSEIYKRLFSLFKESLVQQSIVGTLQLEQGDPTAYVSVPFWTWTSHLGDVAKVLIEHKDTEELRFSWPLLADSLQFCQCVMGGTGLEIAPRCIPVDVIPAFQSAKRRIYMTATLADDGVLVTHFDADSNSIAAPIKPDGAGDMGDRMILVPQKINPAALDSDLRDLVADVAKTVNAVVIVPSHKRASFWKPVAQQVLDASTIEAGVAQLRNKKHVGLTVLVNKYDGIDLPGDACRLLVVDGLPEVYGLSERVEFTALDGTELQLVRQVQRIEQGMGRGVRSSDDYCVVLLSGRRLTERLNHPAARRRFSAATQAQLTLGESVAAQLKGKPIGALKSVMQYCLNQDAQWVDASRAALANATDTPGFLDPTVVPKRKAFNAARTSLWNLATDVMQKVVNATSDPSTRGYLMQQLAEYVQHTNPAEAQQILLSGLQFNARILKPLSGIAYSKLTPPVVEQATQATEFMKQFASGNDLVIWANGLIEDLSWDEDGTYRFEAAIKSLGLFLGFGSQRPEIELGKGPDNLWALGGLRYLVIECKSGASAALISKGDCNQLTGSMEWFAANYDNTCEATPIIIHPSFTFDHYSSPRPETKVIDSGLLSQLKQRLTKLAASLSESTVRNQPHAVAALFKEGGFTASAFVSNFTKMYAMSKR